ncbi:hypothetical protein CHLRE_02g095146v5 [Chlamydomonas reinhardtii]|uniref:Uncharacterized protein n=1 Tax=Chlamydomonas reinhardtii TaxID=3055 RepID=A8JEG6_CHLRE|nr:uncharacterized protein CHLRE_02g095146v5 [Chlamydomonas reinhardtii]PNW86764.1 hypothetical protein CHLRE_02g095146v5 [Chlamydomonas reinhardtii]|eukprot:XP_001701174.1 predicted protein [Chlamydomonas reinhardtii]
MADESAPLTKREFLEMSCMILGEILSPQMLRPALEAAAAKLAVPDGTALVSTLLAEKAAQAAKGKGKSKKAADNGEQKEKKKRDLTTYNLFMTWFSDFAMNYGHHPAIQKMKQDNPTLKYGVAMTGEFYRTLSEDVKNKLKESVDPFIKNYSSEHPGEGAMAAVRAYEAAHPDKTFSKLLKLEAKQAYKTDPANMKQEAATARKAAEGGATPAPAAAPPVGATPASAKTGDEEKKKEKKRRKEEEAAKEEGEEKKKSKKDKEGKKDKEREKDGEKSTKKEKKKDK